MSSRTNRVSLEGLRPRQRRSLVAAILVLITFVMEAPSGASSAGSGADLTGTWHCFGEGGAAAQDWSISGGSGIGALLSGTVFSSNRPSMGGDDVTIVTFYNSFAPGYIATVSGTISSDGKMLSGSWESNRHQGGAWTATRATTPRLEVSVAAPATVGAGHAVVE